MNRKIVILLLTVLTGFQLQFTEKEDSVALVMFNKTLSLINEYSYAHGEHTGSIAAIIADNVYKIVYIYDDSAICLEKKLDLLHLMLFNQRYASNQYRSIIFDKVLNQDSLILGRGEFITPLLFCHYCGDTKVLESIRNNNCLNFELDQFPEEYKNYFQQLVDILKSIDSSQVSNSKLKITLRFMSMTRNLREELLKKYPIFKDE
jgi:hypothetical protein